MYLKRIAIAMRVRLKWRVSKLHIIIIVKLMKLLLSDISSLSLF